MDYDLDSIINLLLPNGLYRGVFILNLIYDFYSPFGENGVGFNLESHVIRNRGTNNIVSDYAVVISEGKRETSNMKRNIKHNYETTKKLLT